MNRKLGDHHKSQVITDQRQPVGYGNPPLHSRFQKGESGNPKGRPRGSAKIQFASSATNETETSAQRILNEPVTIIVKGLTKKVSLDEAVTRHKIKHAFGGSINLLRDIAKEIVANELQKANSIDDNHAYWRDYSLCRERYFRNCRNRKIEPDEFWIASEDIIMESGKFVRVKGAESEEQLSDYELLEKFRNALIVENCYQIYCRRRDEDGITAFPLMIAHLERLLSTQANLRGQILWDELQDATHWSFKHLEERRMKAWADLGITSMPRFVEFPPLPSKYKTWLKHRPKTYEEELDHIIQDAKVRGKRPYRQKRYTNAKPIEDWEQH